MTTVNEKPIGENTSIFTKPRTAVRNFAAGTVEYVMFGLDQIVSRLPLIDYSAVNVAKKIPEINLLIKSGSFSRISLKEDIDEYEAVTSGILEKKVDMGTYLEYQKKLLNIYHDVDYFSLLMNKPLTEEEERNYRNNKITEFLSQIPKETLQALNIKTFYPDVHHDSMIFERQFKLMNKSAEEKRSRSEEEYSAYIESIDKITRPVIDERTTKTEVPVVLYTSETIDNEVSEIVCNKIKMGALRTREDWDNTTLLEAMNSFEELFPEQHKEEIGKIKEEVYKGFYGAISISEMSTIVLQKLGLV
jgi:hypothetical protein